MGGRGRVQGHAHVRGNPATHAMGCNGGESTQRPPDILQCKYTVGGGQARPWSTSVGKSRTVLDDTPVRA